MLFISSPGCPVVGSSKRINYDLRLLRAFCLGLRPKRLRFRPRHFGGFISFRGTKVWLTVGGLGFKRN